MGGDPVLSGSDEPRELRLVKSAYEQNKLALFVGSGLSLGADVGGNFPTCTSRRWRCCSSGAITRCPPA
jgi:hypothetical protein